jgi:hypothetical protein
MAHEIRSQQPSVSRRQSLPDPFYYLNNFEAVLVSLERRYAPLLSIEERQFIAHFGALPQASRALLVRLIMRTGTLFRRSRLNYIEIGEVSDAVAPLCERGWVEARPVLDVGELQKLLTKAELLDYFALPLWHRKLKKPGLVAILHAQYSESRPFNAWCKESDDCVYRLVIARLCDRLRLMFFGNFRQNFREFVLADLGVFSYEKVAISVQSSAFRTRAHIDAFEQLYRCRQGLEAGLELKEVAAVLPSPVMDCDWLEDLRQRILFQIAIAYERKGDSISALALYSTCSHRGARIRSIRLRERAREWSLARDLCLTAQHSPHNDAEHRQAQGLLRRLNRKLGISETEPYEAPRVPAFEMVLDMPAHDYAVEYCVRDHLVRQARGMATVHFVESSLINSLFGLLCWRAVFEPVPGAFFHNFHDGPADLLSDRFYQRRQREFTECLAELRSDRYKATIRQCFVEKAGIQSPFVGWGLLSGCVLDSALTCFPAAHLRLWFEWIVRDVKENRAGFPDLVQFWPLERRYRMIEVKGPGDRLQENQRRLLEFCVSHQMPVSVCHVRWVQ